MTHLRTITREPARASSDICAGIDNDFQARLCFLFQFLVSFILPLAEAKQSTSETA